jgi:hypothetical protein
VKGFDRFDLRSLQLVITNKTNVRRAASPASPRGATATPPAHASQSGDAGGLPSVAAQSRCRCGRGESGPGADVAAVSPVLVQMWRRALRHAGPSKHRAEPSGAGRGGSARRKPIRSRLRRRGCRRRRRRRQLRPSGPGRVTPVERRSAGGGGCYRRAWSVWHRDRRDGRQREPSARRLAGRRPFFRSDAATM